VQTLLNHLNNIGRSPLDFKPDMNPAVVAFLVKAVDRNPNLRYQTTADFRDALKRLPKEID